MSNKGRKYNNDKCMFCGRSYVTYYLPTHYLNKHTEEYKEYLIIEEGKERQQEIARLVSDGYKYAGTIRRSDNTVGMEYNLWWGGSNE